MRAIRCILINLDGTSPNEKAAEMEFFETLTSTGGGEKKIFDQRMKVEGKSKVGSTDNMKHKAGGGNVKVGPNTRYKGQQGRNTK